MTKASTEATMAGGKVQWAVRGVAPDLQRRTVEVAAARGITVGSIVTDALTARLDALERDAGPANRRSWKCCRLWLRSRRRSSLAGAGRYGQPAAQADDANVGFGAQSPVSCLMSWRLSSGAVAPPA
jgi:hypothetical protein